MEQALAELNQKIDALAAQVAYLAEQAQLAERQREERSELMRDLTPIADQAYHMAIAQLVEVQEYIDLGDLLRLMKRLMRNGRFCRQGATSSSAAPTLRAITTGCPRHISPNRQYWLPLSDTLCLVKRRTPSMYPWRGRTTAFWQKSIAGGCLARRLA